MILNSVSDIPGEDQPVFYKFSWAHPLMVYLRPDYVVILNMQNLMEKTPWNNTTLSVLAAELLAQADFSEAITDILYAIERGAPSTQVNLIRTLSYFENSQLEQVVQNLPDKLEFPSYEGLILDLRKRLGMHVQANKLVKLYKNNDTDIKIFVLQLLGDSKWKGSIEILKAALKDKNPFLRQVAAVSAQNYMEDKSIRSLFYPLLYDIDPYVRASSIATLDAILDNLPQEELVNFIISLKNNFFDHGELKDEHLTKLLEPDIAEAVPFQGMSMSIRSGAPNQTQAELWKRLSIIFQKKDFQYNNSLIEFSFNEQDSLSRNSVFSLIMTLKNSKLIVNDLLRLTSEKDSAYRALGIYGLRILYRNQTPPLKVRNRITQIISSKSELPLLRLFAVESLGLISHGLPLEFTFETLPRIPGIKNPDSRLFRSESQNFPEKLDAEYLLQEWEVMPQPTLLAAFCAALYGKYDRKALQNLIILSKSVSKEEEYVTFQYLKSFAKEIESEDTLNSVEPQERYFDENSLMQILKSLSALGPDWVRDVAKNYISNVESLSE